MSKTVYIVDIDSTIAENSHRAALLKKQCIVCLHEPMPQGHHLPCPNCGNTVSKITQESWDMFLDPELVALDTPIPRAITVLNRMRQLGFEIHFITGRNETHTGDVTKKWLKDHAGWQDGKEKLIMRQETEHGMPASKYKALAFERLKKECGFDESNTYVFFEDDPHVFGVYENYGIVVRCPEGWQHFMPAPATGSELAWAR